MIRIVLADDEALVRDGLRAILSSEPDFEVVGEAATGVEAVSCSRETEPDVVLMDVRMPLMDGVQACRRIVAARAHVRVLMLTTFDHDDYLVSAIRAGASGFLLKHVRRDQLVAAIRAAVSGDTVVAPVIVRRLLDSYNPPAAVDPSPHLSALTDREREVLELLARGATNSEIAKRLYVSESTVKTHIARLTAKLGLRDRIHAVIYAYECGLVRPGADGNEDVTPPTH